MYAPPIGRWLSEDPAGYVDGPNQYLYVRNNPINRADPSGMQDFRGPGGGIHFPGFSKKLPPIPPTPPASPPAGKCFVELECIKLVGIGSLGTAEHCGLKLTSSNGTVTRQHVRDGKCQFVGTPGALGWLSGTYFLRDSFTVPSQVCDCIAANAARFNAAGLSYSFPFPVNSECGAENKKCNSNYAAKCVMQHCGLTSSLNSSLIPPAGWDFRNQQCTSVWYIQSKTGCCSCLAWKTVDASWCSARTLAETTANPNG